MHYNGPFGGLSHIITMLLVEDVETTLEKIGEGLYCYSRERNTDLAKNIEQLGHKVYDLKNNLTRARLEK